MQEDLCLGTIGGKTGPRGMSPSAMRCKQPGECKRFFENLEEKNLKELEGGVTRTNRSKSQATAKKRGEKQGVGEIRAKTCSNR